MKKFAIGLSVLSMTTFIIAWGVIGLKIFDGDYDITIGAYIGLISIILFFSSILYIKWTRRCQKCGRVLQSNGSYCPHCGSRIE